jgi:hypothetical protein
MLPTAGTCPKLFASNWVPSMCRERNNVTMTAALVNAAVTASVDARKELLKDSATCQVYYDAFCQKVLNEGQACWDECQQKQGHCAFCGTGMCCPYGWNYTNHSGCAGTIGVDGDPPHVCAKPGPEPVSSDCAWACALNSKELELSGGCTSKYTDCSVKNGTGDKVLSCESVMKMATAVCGRKANDTHLVSLVNAYRTSGSCANTLNGGVEFEPVTSEKCVDDATWTDPVSPTKASCLVFRGLDCSTQYKGFSTPEIVKKFCPKTCGECVDCLPMQYPNTSSCDCAQIEVRGHPSLRFNGVYQKVNDCSQLEVMQHPNSLFNGIYTKALGQWNGHDHWVKNYPPSFNGVPAVYHLYFYTGSKSWNLAAVSNEKELQDGLVDMSQGGWISAQPGSGAHGIHTIPTDALGATITKLDGMSMTVCSSPCTIKMQCTGKADKWNGRDHWMNCDKHLYFYNQSTKMGWNLGSVKGISEFKEGKADKFQGGWATLQPGQTDASIGPVYSGKQVVLTLAACDDNKPCQVTMECTGKPPPGQCKQWNNSGKLDDNSVYIIIAGGTSECGAGAKCVCLQSCARRGFGRLVN